MGIGGEMSKYFTPKLGRLWRRVKRSDRSEGAASEVRHIDPATYQPSEEVAKILRPPPRQNKTVALLDEADKLLVTDAKRRYGKRYSKHVRNKIVTGRY
jgi:hypothetical protein